MNSLPFSISFEAATWILKKVRMCENEPDATDLVPGLYLVLNEYRTDEEGCAVEWCPGPFFDILWEHPDTVASEGYVEMEILGRKLFSPPETLEELEDKQLILETVDVGFPTPSDKKREVLKAIPREP